MMPRVSRNETGKIMAEYDNGVVSPDEVAASSGDNEIFGNFFEDLNDLYGYTAGAAYPSTQEEVFEQLLRGDRLGARARKDLSNGFIVDEVGFPVYFTRKQHCLIMEAMSATDEEYTNMRNRFLSEDALDQEYLNAFALS
jgi:hypothetical protein